MYRTILSSLLILGILDLLFTKKIQQLQTENPIEFKGITFVGDKYCPQISFDDPLALISLNKLKETGANWVAIVVTEYQDTINSTNIGPYYKDYPHNDYFTYKTETMEGLEKVIKHSHSIGLNVMLKPHIDLSKEKNYTVVWRGDIGKNFNTTAQWDAWFVSYEKFILKYAQLAAKLNVKMFSMSCELIQVSRQDVYWRKIVKNVKKVYPGLLTDSANHDGEEFNKTWWNELDYIGVDAYYLPIKSDDMFAYQKQIDTFLTNKLQQLKMLAKIFQKDVIITEIGFCSGNCKRGEIIGDTEHYLQAYFYERFIKVFSQEKFIKGYFWWAWNTDPYFGGRNDVCISPQYKLSEYIIRKYYGGDLKKVTYLPEKAASCPCTI